MSVHRSAHPCRRPLSFDVLESRQLLAGNVLVALDLDTGLLQITGDERANRVRVVADGALIRVVGEDNTTINGTTAAFAPLSSQVLSINMNMGLGNDTVIMVARAGSILTGFNLTGDLSISTGAGNDTVTMIAQNERFTSGFELDGSLLIDTGAGSDAVLLRAANKECNGFSGALLGIATGPGADSVRLVALNRDTSFSGFNGFFFGNMIIDSGIGPGVVKLDARNRSGNGFNIVSNLNITAGPVNDSVQLLGRQILGRAFFLQGNLNINTSSGADNVVISAKNAFSFTVDPKLVTLNGSSDADVLTDSVFRGTAASISNFESIIVG